MKTLIGVYLTCTVSFQSINPAINRPVTVTATDIKCQVIDDRFMTVGTSDWQTEPIVVDCRKEIMWLKPINTDGIFTFLKGDKHCDYDKYKTI